MRPILNSAKIKTTVSSFVRGTCSARTVRRKNAGGDPRLTLEDGSRIVCAEMPLESEILPKIPAEKDASVTRRMPIREPIGVALETLRAHKMRSFLTLLGIILSVSTLIVVIALISGVNRYIADRVANLGSNVFLLTRFPIITDVEEYVKANRRNKKVRWDDYEALRANMKLPERVGVELRTSGKVRMGSQSLEDCNIRGVTANMVDIDIVTPADGRYISEGDDQSRALVTMIGQDVATKLFPNVDAIGRELLIEGRPFQVVGIAKPIGSVLGQSQDNFAYIPIQTYFKMF